MCPTSVMLVMLDGLRADAVDPIHTPVLSELQRRGTWTLEARSVTPSVTLPCHMSIFHSVPPARHGVTTNIYTPPVRPVPGLIDLAYQHGRRCAMFHSFEPLRDVSRPGALAFSFYRHYTDDAVADQEILQAAIAYLSREWPDFAFIYLGSIDSVGHLHGWMSPPYLAQVQAVDALLGELVAHAPPEYALVVHADHGGHDRVHGTDAPEDMIIPWMVVGPGIRVGHRLESPVSLLDTAPVVARLLGFPAPREWEGRVPEELFDV